MKKKHKMYRGDLMSKLPSIYKEKITTKNNNKKYCYVTNKEDIKNEILNLFKSQSLHNLKVLIKTPLKEYRTYIYEYNNEFIKTIQNEKISLDDIVSIKRIS